MTKNLYSPERFSDNLDCVIQASRSAKAVRACLLSTRDRDYALSMVKKPAAAQQCPLYLFTVAGRKRYNPDNMKWDAVSSGQSDPAGLLQYAQELRGGGLVILEDCLLPLRDEGGDPRMRMALTQMLADDGLNEALVLVFLEPPESESRLPSILADQFVRLDVPYPRLDELDAIARNEIAVAAHRSGTPMDVKRIQTESERLASGMVGMTRSSARDALRDALAPDPNDFEAACSRLQQRKKIQLSRELAMNVLETTSVEAPIGLDYLEEFLMIYRKKIGKFGEDRARGILLIGPPGTGKSMLAKTIGRIVELPVVEFKISALMNSLLGETERRFSQAFATLEAMAPNVVFIDEIEKAFGDSSERDGGTMMRCTGSLLSWLSDNPYPNFIVATSNSLRRMGEIGLTMTRSERFDTSFFVDVPNMDSRCRMLKRWILGSPAQAEDTVRKLAEMTEKFSGADLRSIVKHAIARAEHLGVQVTLEILANEIERKRMRALALYDEFQELRRWGRRYCDPAGPTDG